LEHFDVEGARASWQASLELNPSAWAWRNLSVLTQLQGNASETLDALSRAWELDSISGWHTLALAQEYLKALCNAKYFAQAQAVYNALSPALQSNDRIQILSGRIALELGDLELVEQVMQREYAIVREGETELTDIWFEMWYRRLQAQANPPLDEEAKAQIRKLHPPPAHIDFRSILK